jgi:hypothetical protein
MKASTELDIGATFSLDVLEKHREIVLLHKWDEVWPRSINRNISDIVNWMSLQAPAPKKQPPEPKPVWSVTYWAAFKTEFLIFLCTKNRKYQGLRRQVATYGRGSQVAAVGAISAAIGANTGVAAGVLTPIVIICLIAVLKLGKEAFCKAANIDLLAPYTGDPTPRPSRVIQKD